MGRELGAFLSTTSQAGSNFEIAFLVSDDAGHHRERLGRPVREHDVRQPRYARPRLCAMRPTEAPSSTSPTSRGASPPTRTSCTPWTPTNAWSIAATWSITTRSKRQPKRLACPSWPATIETHNAHALAGEEDEFGRKNLPYIDTYSGIWVVSCLPTFYLTTGGLGHRHGRSRAHRSRRSRSRACTPPATYAAPSRRRTAAPTPWASTRP